MTEEESRIYQEISEKFKELVGQDKVIQSLAEKIASGKATYQDAWDYANRIGKAGSKAMLSQVDELVSDGIDGYESIMESMYECYDASATYAAAVQTIQNQKAGVGIKGLQADFDKDRASGIAHLGSNAEDAASAARYLGTPVEHFTENVVGDTIKANEAFQYQSGLNPKIKRTSTGKCCQWCDEIAGVYDYPAPDEVYRRHQNCNCLVEYYPGNGLKQNAHTKRIEPVKNLDRSETNVWKDRHTPDKQKAIQQYERKFEKATTIEDARSYLEKNLGLDDSSYYYKDINLEVANRMNFEIRKAYDAFGDLHKKGVLDGIRVLQGKKGSNVEAAYSHPMKEIFLFKDKVSYKSSIGKLKSDALNNYQKGFWSTGSEMHFVRHELGHAVRYTINESQFQEIEEIRKGVCSQIGLTKWNEYDSIEMKRAAGKYLSYYGLMDTDEFIAESVAEFMEGRPRKTASSVIRILRGR